MRTIGLIAGGLAALTWLGAAHRLSTSVYARGLAESVEPQSSAGEIEGIPWTGEPGITETVAEIMARERRAPKAAATRPRPTKREIELRKLLPPRRNPAGPSAAVSRWPILERALAAPLPYNPQTVGTSFLGAQLSESGFIPPDSMGDVGPSQILVAINGRIKVFDKNGVLGSLNVTMNTFFNSVRGGVGVSDPHVRYDRLSQRWFVTIINVPSQGPNRVLIAMSSPAGSPITSTSSFTFFQFQQDTVGAPGPDLNGFADYDTLGVDRLALYIGVNMFNQAGDAFVGTTGFVVRKSSLIAGTPVVTAFRQMVNTMTCGGPLSPQGVNNDDPAAAEGYFIGEDPCFFNTLQIRRVSNPGGTPTLSSDLTVTVPKTREPIDQVQPAPGLSLDALDDRLFAAAIHQNKITGASTLWTAHNLQVDTSGVACGPPDPGPCTGGGRNGSRWYEIGSLTGTPTLLQAGTLLDSAGSNPLGYWIPSVAMSGQGHMAIGTSRAGASAANGYAGVAVAGRLNTDPSGATQAPTLAQSSSFVYNVEFPPPPSPPPPPQRWGDYSQTVVDPNDDMTMWTFQEYTNATNSYGVRAIKLIAPPPATPNCAVPAQVTTSPQNVTITGTSSAGSGFFDPGPDTGGPGYNRLTASVTPGVIINSVTFNGPTSVTLNISSSSNGTKNVTLTNPDGQSVVGTGCIVVNIQADLSITKTDGRTTTPAGSPVTYTITVSNAGPSAATGATVADTFPASLTGVTWTCVASGGSSCAAASGSGNINQPVNLLVGGTATFTATGTLDINASGTLSNTATVTPPAAITDPNTANNSATDSDTIIPAADLSITKTDGNTTARAGSPVTYTITASNGGPGSVTGASVVDNFPASLAGVTWTCTASAGSSCAAASGSGNINQTVNLLVGGTVTFVATGTLSINASGTLSNTATVSSGNADPNTANNSATDNDTIIPAADLSITKTDGKATTGAGSPVTYTITVSNAGPGSVTGATVVDNFPASLAGVTWTCTASAGSTCTPGPVSGSINDTVNLPVGATVTYTLSGTVSASATNLSNTATITAPASVNDPNAANNTATDMDILLCASVVVVVPDGRLTQATLAAGATAWFGASLKIGDSYSVEFKNTTGGVRPGTLTVFNGDDGCAGGSTLATNDTSAIDPSGTGGIVRSSFTATGAQPFFQARLVNTTGGPVTLTFAWSDTTHFSPAWSTNGSFDTYFSFLNATGAPLSGTLTLLDRAGAVVSTFPISIPAGQSVSTNTSALGVTRNRTGTTKFVHNGPPGSILTEAAIANFTISPAYVQPVKFQPVRDAK